MFLVDPAPLTRQDLANIVTSRAMQVLLISVISMLTAQILKVIFYSIKDKRPRFELFISTGGFPSSHTAFCIALDISLGMIQWYTENKLDWSFTVAVVFSAIVIHDATGVRLEASKHAKILNRIAENLTEEEKKELGYGKKGHLKEMLGHRTREVLGGAVVGTIIGMIGALLVIRTQANPVATPEATANIINMLLRR
ncbi:MAG: divergent PAP2 family protein [Acholeplasmatales bacterium]|nr:divergent PAP2 family protein [Acholeplasmatales bacterium]